MRILKVALFLLLALLVSLLAVRLLYINQLAAFVLQKAGAEEVSVHVSEFDFTQLSLDDLTASFLLADGAKLSVQLTDISLQYSLQQLLTMGRCERLSIDAMEISRFPVTVKKTALPLQLPKEIVLLEDDLRRRLPLRELQINQLMFHGAFPSPLREKPAQLIVSHKDTAIQAGIVMEAEAGSTLKVGLQSPDSRRGTATLVVQQAGVEQLQAKVSLEPENFSGRLALQLEGMRELMLQLPDFPELPQSGGSLLLDVDIPLPFHTERTFSGTAQLVDPVFSGLKVAAAELQFAGGLKDGAIVLDAGSRFDAINISTGTIGLERLSLDISGKLRQTKEQLLFEFSDQQKLEIRGVATEKVQLSDINVQLDNSLHLLLHNSAWSVAAANLTMDPLQIQEDDRSYSFGAMNWNSFELKKAASGPELMADITIPTALFERQDQQLSLKDLSGRFRFREKKISGQLQLAPERIPARVEVAFQHDLLHGDGSFTMETTEQLNLYGEEMHLSSLFSSWPFPFDLDGGEIFCRADGSWQSPNKIELSASVSLTRGDGYLKGFLFDGLELRQDLVLLPQLRSKSEGSVALDHLEGGIDVYDVQALLSVSPSEFGPLPQLQVNTFRASLFEGSIASSAIEYDLNQPDSRFTVDIKEINLGKLVSLIKMDPLFVSGSISGSIPVTIKGGNFSVESGELHSEEPGGEIRYTPGETNQTGITRYALKAVEELHYKTLRATANYMPSGQLDLDIALKGNSPGLDSNRPVHLNIHAEQNLPTLLQSLRSSKGLTEELDKRVKQHYNKKE